tara:strand:+ start:5022 stop:7184 length:2163 start_codon:yes stop_codon:yes gene_type:complete
MKLLSIQKKRAEYTHSLNHLSSGTLADYLICLGFFKVISKQLDQNARGYWKNNVFQLDTSKSQAEIVEFFTTQYQPLPFFCPWLTRDSKAETVEVLVDTLSDTRFKDQFAFGEQLLQDVKGFDPSLLDNGKHEVKISGKEVVYKVPSKKPGQTRDHKYTRSKQTIAYLFRNIQNEDFRDILCGLATPYVDFYGISTVNPSVLGNGMYGRLANSKNMDFVYWNSILQSESKHYEAALFGTPNPDCNIPNVNLPHLDSYGSWYDQSQFGIGYQSASLDKIKWNGEKVLWGSNPVRTTLMIEAMTFFRGKLSTGGSSTKKIVGVDFDESTVKEKQFPSVPLTIKNNSIGFESGNWTERKKDNMAVYELWAPYWSNEFTYRGLVSEIRNMSEVAFINKTTFEDSYDMMEFLSNVGNQLQIDFFGRFAFLDRLARGNKVNAPLEKFYCNGDNRYDVITAIKPALRKVNSLLNSNSIVMSSSLLLMYQTIQEKVQSYMKGSSSLLDISIAFADFSKHCLLSPAYSSLSDYLYPTKKLDSGNDEKKRGKAQVDKSTYRFTFNEKWVSHLLEESNTPEVRLALSMATKQQVASFTDMSNYLTDTLDNDLLDKLAFFFEMCKVPQDLPVPTIPHQVWLPMDFLLASLLKNTLPYDPSNSDKRAIDSWYDLINDERAEDAYEVAMERLRLRGVMRKNYPVFTTTSSSSMVRLLDLNLNKETISHMRKLVA